LVNFGAILRTKSPKLPKNSTFAPQNTRYHNSEERDRLIPDDLPGNGSSAELAAKPPRKRPPVQGITLAEIVLFWSRFVPLLWIVFRKSGTNCLIA